MPASGVARSQTTYRRMLSLLQRAAGSKVGKGSGSGDRQAEEQALVDVAELERELRNQGLLDGILFVDFNCDPLS